MRASAVGGEILARDPALDGLRGLAIALVLVDHVFPLAPTSTALAAARMVAGSLFIGVDLFFVLSGFLITTILIRTRASPQYFRNFYARRILRIFPAYYLILTFVFVFGSAVFHNFPDRAQVLENAPYFLFYVQNLVMSWRGEWIFWIGLVPTWSLAIEEQFYLIWPAVVLFTVPRRLVPTCLSVALVSVILKVYLATKTAPLTGAYMCTFSHMEGLAAGAALAAWTSSNPGRPFPAWLSWLGIGALVCLAAELAAWAAQLLSAAVHMVATVTLASILFSWVVAETLMAPRSAVLSRVLQARPLVFLGTYSYGVYLIHSIVLARVAPMLHGWQSALGKNGGIVAAGVVMVCITLLLAVAMFHVIERPMLQLKRYFVPRGIKPVPAAPLQ